MTPSVRLASSDPAGEQMPSETPSSASGTSVSVVLFCSQNATQTPAILSGLVEFVEEAGADHELIIALDGHLAGLEARFDEEYASHSQVKIVRLNSTHGQVATIRAGIAVARGEWIVTYPSYPQVRPDAILPILEGLRSGHDYVVGAREGRDASVMSRLGSRTFNGLVRLTTGIALHDIACGLHGLRASVGRVIPNYGENQLYLPILLSRDGYRVVEVNVPADNSKSARRRFSLSTFGRHGLDLLTLSYLVRFTQKPLRPFGALGIALLFSGLLLGAVLVYQRLVLAQALADRPLLLLALLLITAGVQVVILGFLGELLIYLHYRDQVNYRVHECFSGREDESSRRTKAPEVAEHRGE